MNTAAGNLGLENKKVGMLVFLFSEIMFFTGFLGAYTVLRHTAKTWPAASTLLNFPLGIFSTCCLVLSSFIFALNLKNKKNKEKWFPVLILGILFFGAQFWEYLRLWTEKNIRFSDSLFGAFFYVLTVLHGLHVFVGVLLLVWAMRAFKTAEKFETLGLYWYFVTAVWLVFFVVFYLIS